MKNQPALISCLQINLHYFNIALFLRLDSLTFIYSQLLNLKWISKNASPHIISYRNYKNFDNDIFRSEIQSFYSLNKSDLGLFKESIFCIFSKHAPIRNKYLCENEAPFMTKELHNAIMKRSRYKNKFLKDKSQTNRENYKIQRKLCKKLLRKTKHCTLKALIQSKSRIIEPFGKLLFPFSQKKASKGYP